MSGSIGRRELVEDTRVTLGGIAVAVDEGRATLGYLHVAARPSKEERERRAAHQARRNAEDAEPRRHERHAFTKQQPSVTVTAADVAHVRLDPQLTLARAYEALEELGGRILLGDGGTLRSTLPAQFDPRPNANARCSATTL